VTKYTDGGSVTLAADHGAVSVAKSATVNVSAQKGGGNAGSLSVTAPEGTFTLADGSRLLGQKGAGGQGGAFAVDVSSLPGEVAGTSSVALLGATLNGGGFNQSASIRVRTGDIAVDGLIKARQVNFSADAGSITVTGKGAIDASGATGGSAELAATGGITLDSGASISVQAQDYDNAGKGGTVTLAAGSSTVGTAAFGALGSGPQLNLLPGSTIDLSVVNNRALQLNTSGASSVAIPAGVLITLPTGTPGNDVVTFSSGGTLTTPDGVATSFAAGFMTAVVPRSVVVLSSPGSIAFAAGGTGGAVPLNLPAGTSITSTGVADLTAYNTTGTLHLRAPQAVDGSGAPTGANSR